MKRIAIVVQDGMKKYLYKIVNDHKTFLMANHIIATSGTADYLYDLELSVNKIVPAGSHGGDISIANMIVEAQVDALIFLINPLQKFPHNEDVLALIRLCNVKNVPLATNAATADIILSHFG